MADCMTGLMTHALCILLPQNVHVPREVVWLNGAPGSGKVRGGLQARTDLRGLQVGGIATGLMRILHPDVLFVLICLQGANTHHILQTRGLEHCISMSELLVGTAAPCP